MATVSPTTSTSHLSPSFADLLRPHVIPAADFDQHLRYGYAAQLLSTLCAVSRPVKILEVGSNVLNLWPNYLENVEVTRSDVDSNCAGQPDFVQLQPDEPLPFEDNSFNAVVAIEVLEHMPASSRPQFIRECLRVAQCGVVLSCPNGVVEVMEAEELAAQAFSLRTGDKHPFLREHREFGLPEESEIRAILESCGLPFWVHGQAPLDIWLASMLLSEHVARHALQRELGQRLTGLWRKHDSNMLPYRKFYVVAKSAEAEAAMEETTLSRASIVSEQNANPIAPSHLTGRSWTKIASVLNTEHSVLSTQHATPRTASRALIQSRLLNETFFAEVLNNLAGVSAQGLSDLEEERRALHERNQVLDHLMRWSTSTSGWKLTAPLRALQRTFFSRKYSQESLLAWNDLEPGAGADADNAPGIGWRSTGKDPYFLLPCVFPAGWIRIRLEMSGYVRGRAELYADTGEGFSPESCLERITWSGPLRDEIFVYMRKPLFAIRLDPMDCTGSFRLVQFQVESIPSLKAFFEALTRKLKLLWNYHCTGRVLWRGLSMLGRGQFRQVIEHIFQGLPDSRRLDAGGHREKAAYAEWRKQHALTEEDFQRLRAEAEAMVDPPMISVIMPVYNTPETHLQRAIESVRRQTYPFWELCIADDGSSAEHVSAILNCFAGLDSRIRITRLPKNAGISTASNAALGIATGRYIALLDHDDELAEHALSLIAREIVAHPQADMIYSDEDKIEPDDSHSTPFFKPDWCPDWFLTCMYTCHLGVYRAELVRQLGGFRSEYDTAQDYDLALRLVSHIQNEERRKTPFGFGEEQRIRHVSDVLYHWRKAPGSTAKGHKAKPKAAQKAIEAVQSYLNLVGRPGKVEAGAYPGLQRVRYAIQGRPKISIVIPSAGKETVINGRKTTFIGHLVRSIRRLSTYSNYEILVIDNDDMPVALRQELDDLDVVRISYTAPFNLSAKINLGAAKADGDFLLLLNDDMEILTPDWLECLLEHAQWPEVGAVGAKLLFPDGRLQHVGVTFLDQKPYHHFYRSPGHEPGYFCSHLLVRNYSAVTGACLMVRPEVYHEVAGFDESMPLNFNDIDLCLKIRGTGRRIVYTPYAQLLHYESASKTGCFPEELEAFVQRWGEQMSHDPYYNRHLATDTIDYRIGTTPAIKDLHPH
ncbi:MAG TPA: glycosyltransferase [Gemmataceae bacterium]|nr:glycosyltransferase [Gemmataceae bacterium]